MWVRCGEVAEGFGFGRVGIVAGIDMDRYCIAVVCIGVLAIGSIGEEGTVLGTVKRVVVDLLLRGGCSGGTAEWMVVERLYYAVRDWGERCLVVVDCCCPLCSQSLLALVHVRSLVLLLCRRGLYLSRGRVCCCPFQLLDSP